MKARLRFNLDEIEDRLAHKKCVLSDDMCNALWDIVEYLRTVEKYQDPEVAAAAGYQVGVIRGSEHHAQNPAYLNDGRIFDPEYPESLVYAESALGPILVGVMFETDGIGQAGPMIGGPLTVWHSHENVCFSLTPPALTGLMSPFGTCPAGSLNIPVTNEMIHAWILPGVEDQWGHIDDAWLHAYLAGLSALGE